MVAGASGAREAVGASVAFSGVRFKAGLHSNRDGTIAVLTLMDGDALLAWSPALSPPRCSNRRDRRYAARIRGGQHSYLYSSLRARSSAVMLFLGSKVA